MSDETAKSPDMSIKRIAALKMVRDQAEARLAEAKLTVKILNKEFKKADSVFRQAVDEEREPSLFSPGVAVTDDDVESAKDEIAETPDE